MLMQITNNLNQDIENAPQWFKDAVELRPVDKIIEHPLGDISYSKWSSSVDTKNLIIFPSISLTIFFLTIDFSCALDPK